MSEPRPSRTVAIALVIVVLAGGGVAAGVLHYVNQPKPAPVPFAVASGDNATVNYIGILGSGPEQGRVFDTSIQSVALNNATYPKALEYTLRGSASQYTPLPVHVGSSAPSGGYTIGNLTFATVVPGFWQGLLGMIGNQTRILTIPPALAYGPVKPACLVTKPLTFTVPVLVIENSSAFARAFPGVSPAIGTEFPDPTYQWTDLVLNANASSITVERLPSLGFASHPNGWPAVVTNLTSTEITLTNQLSPASAGLVLGHSTGSPTCGSNQFIVSAVNVAAGTFTENYNPEVQGQTLIFIVTGINIYRP